MAVAVITAALHQAPVHFNSTMVDLSACLDVNTSIEFQDMNAVPCEQSPLL